MSELTSLTVFGYMKLHPHHKPFCLEMGVPHGDFEHEYYKKGYGGTKKIKCMRCKRLLMKNGKKIKQRSFPIYIETEFDRFGYDFLKKEKGNEKTW